MVIAILMLLGPVLVYLASLWFARHLRSPWGRVYRVFGGVIVFAGGATSLYLAAHTGDQGGVAAFFFQGAVIVTYGLLSGAVILLNWRTQRRERAAEVR